MPAATYTVEIGWNTNVSGGFTVGISKVGGTDQIGVFTISGWTDESSRIKMVSIQRGSTDDLGQVLGGTCILNLVDINGRYNPTNTTSAIYPYVNPMRPVRIKATYGATDYYRFFGYIQTIQTDPKIDKQEAVITCADLYSWLSQSYPIVTANGTTTTTGTAILRIINLSGFFDPAMVNLATGDTIPDYSADGTTSAMTQIQNLVEAEGGVFYINRSGVATFESRYARYQSPRDVDQSTFNSTMQDMSGMTDVSRIYNNARYTRTGGAQQTYNDDTSRRLYGKRIKTLSSALWINDTQALNAATFFIGLRKDPSAPVRITVNGNSSDALITALLTRDLNDRIGISETRGGTTGSFYLESVTETIIGNNLHSAVMYLSKRPAVVPANY